jgi:hypothetical protein
MSTIIVFVLWLAFCFASSVMLVVAGSRESNGILRILYLLFGVIGLAIMLSAIAFDMVLGG